MRIGVISDTHDRIPGVDAALKFFADQKIELIIHCGDWRYLDTVCYFAEQAHKYTLPVLGVLGNNDLEVEAFLDYASTAPGDFKLHIGVAEFKVDDQAIAIYHGHHHPTLTKTLADRNYKIILFGHSHKPRVETIDGKLIVNPGSTAFSIPRSKDWKPTVVIVETDTLQADIHTLI